MVLNCIISVFEVLQQYLDRPVVRHWFTSVFNRVQLTAKVYHSKHCAGSDNLFSSYMLGILHPTQTAAV